MQTMGDEAARNPPSCLQYVRVIKADVFQGASVDFDLACAGCVGADLWVLSHTATDREGSFPAPPHFVECPACSHVAPLFNPATQGYDGALGHPTGYGVAVSGAPTRSHVDPAAVMVSVIYNIEDEELIGIAEENGIPAVDLFDAFAIFVGPKGTQFTIDYECA